MHMKRYFVTLAVLAGPIILLAACGDGTGKGGGGDGGDAPNRDDFPLAALVHEAAPGDTVLVPAGTYREQLEIRKPLTLEPAGDGPVIIDGECKRESGISISTGSGITIRGITIRNTVNAGVRIGLGDDADPRPERITIDGLTITDFNCTEIEEHYAAGVAAWYSGCCITVTNNTITYRSSGSQLGHGDGIWFKSASDRPSGGGHVISGNTITGGYDGIGGEVESDPRGSFDKDTLIEDNIVSGCWDDGIQVEGGAENVRVQNNQVSGCGTGIAFAAPVTGPLYIERNYIHDLVRGKLENLYCFKVGNEGAGVTYLTENICRTEGDGIAHVNVGLAPIVSRNNCFHVTRYVFEISGPFTGSSFDGDRFWSTGPDALYQWEGERYTDLEFLRGLGHEMTGEVSESCPISSTLIP